MDKKLLEQKLEMWQNKLADLESEYAKVMLRKGEAAQMGDLSENAAYIMAIEDAEMYRTRIAEVKKIIAKVEEDLGVQK